MLNENGIISFQDLSVNDVRFGKGDEMEKNTFLKSDGIMLHFFGIEETRELFGDMIEVELYETEWYQGRGAGKIRRSRIGGLFQLSSLTTRGSTSGASTGRSVLESMNTPH